MLHKFTLITKKQIKQQNLLLKHLKKLLLIKMLYYQWTQILKPRTSTIFESMNFSEFYLFYHVAVDDGKSLLLTTADQHRTVDLHTIDVDAILVKRAATYIVLARQLVVGAYSRLRGHKFLYGISRGAGHAF